MRGNWKKEKKKKERKKEKEKKKEGKKKFSFNLTFLKFIRLLLNLYECMMYSYDSIIVLFSSIFRGPIELFSIID